MRPNLELRLSNSEANVAVVHEALVGFAEHLGLDALELDELDTAVAEACKNVVWHAYDGADGPLEVELHALAGAVHAVVRDEGIGIRPHLGESRPRHVGIGMALIHMRARRVTYTNLDGGGTELVMEFELPSVRALVAEDEPQAQPQSSPTEREVRLSLAPGALAGAVLPRVLGRMGELAGFSREATLELHALAREVLRGGGGQARCGLTILPVAPNALELQLGHPLALARRARAACDSSALLALSGDSTLRVVERG